jgi:radical SAM protein with 4Fe4S-binding SPASM domain
MKNSNTYENPDVAIWEITLQCNLKCLHCGSSAGNARPDELTTKEALQLCRDLRDLGFKGISLMGGEVFLRKDWEALSKEIKDLGMTLSIITNGFFKPDAIIPKLVRHKTDCLMVGFDGASSRTQDHIRGVKGAFKKTKEFILAAKKAGLPLGIITTVHKQNFEALPAIKEFVVSEEIDWQIQEATPIGRFPKELILSENEYYSLGLFILSLQKRYANANFQIIGAHNFGFHSGIIPALSSYPEWKGCYAGKTILGIQSNGDIKGCLALSDEFIEDNIKNRNIKDIWNDPKAFAYNRTFTSKNLGPNCTPCEHRENCKGGCITRSSSITGIAHNDPFCFHRIEKKMSIKPPSRKG